MKRDDRHTSNPVIEMDRVAVSYDGNVVLRDVSLQIPKGGFVGLIGPSGAGKTTLLRAMLGLAPTVSGRVVVGGRDVQPSAPPTGIGYVPQVSVIDWNFPVSVENVVLMGKRGPHRLLPWPSMSERRQVSEMLDRLGIGALKDRHIRSLSGGQQQRTFLARALIGNPDILILDEPTASVDIKTRDDVLHLLAELRQRGTTIVMTTHELNSLAAHLPWVVCVNGGITAQGPPAAVFTSDTMSKTFETEMRVLVDDETGAALVAEAGSHAPFSVDPPIAADSRAA